MKNKPDVMVWLAIIVAFGAVLTGFMSPDESQASLIVSENLIR